MSFPVGNANANNKKYAFPVTPFSTRNDNRIANFFRLRNIENDLNDFIKFQEAEHARFMQYAGDMIFRSMYVPFKATYEKHPQYSAQGVEIAAGATTKVPVACTISVDNLCESASVSVTVHCHLDVAATELLRSRCHLSLSLFS